MKTISQLFDSAFKAKNNKDWEKIFIAIDIHETILEPTWSDKRSHVYYPMAKECLQLLSQMPDVCLIQWSSSSPVNNMHYNMEFDTEGVNFQYTNRNPEVPSTSYADFDSKFYVSVILDDKSGFEPSDWIELYDYLIKLKEERER